MSSSAAMSGLSLSFSFASWASFSSPVTSSSCTTVPVLDLPVLVPVLPVLEDRPLRVSESLQGVLVLLPSLRGVLLLRAKYLPPEGGLDMLRPAVSCLCLAADACALVTALRRRVHSDCNLSLVCLCAMSSLSSTSILVMAITCSCPICSCICWIIWSARCSYSARSWFSFFTADLCLRDFWLSASLNSILSRDMLVSSSSIFCSCRLLTKLAAFTSSTAIVQRASLSTTRARSTPTSARASTSSLSLAASCSLTRAICSRTLSAFTGLDMGVWYFCGECGVPAAPMLSFLREIRLLILFGLAPDILPEEDILFLIMLNPSKVDSVFSVSCRLMALLSAVEHELSLPSLGDPNMVDAIFRFLSSDRVRPVALPLLVLGDSCIRSKALGEVGESWQGFCSCSDLIKGESDKLMEFSSSTLVFLSCLNRVLPLLALMNPRVLDLSSPATEIVARLAWLLGASIFTIDGSNDNGGTDREHRSLVK
mmetsp:Transcript_21295/g.47319  ORF Transcript_21295/g.47319 Transcript_21295/m.47319 type:complete len:482 (-) Transcript_21295:6-1451(-)